uniref:Uncharacterized protein n=1 Tax=Anguilla anguilla TaxID=7936 RepID=A0A0E9U9S8_ANGAN
MVSCGCKAEEYSVPSFFSLKSQLFSRLQFVLF